MFWLKRCVVPTRSHEVVITDVVYPTVILAHGKSFVLLPAMVVGIQRGLQALKKSFCQVEAIVDMKGNPIKDSNGQLLVKTPSLRDVLPYTYLMAWYVMYCPSLMTAVSASEGFVLFMQ